MNSSRSVKFVNFSNTLASGTAFATTAMARRETADIKIARLFIPFTVSEYALSATDELGYTTIFWSLAYVDWLIDKQKGKEYAYRSVMDNIHNGAIILMHTVSSDNKEALKDIIMALKENYEFKTLDDLVVSI